MTDPYSFHHAETYFSQLDCAITVCDAQGIVLWMNEKADLTFQKWGGKKLIGQSLLECHNEKSREKIHEILTTGVPNTYAIEKLGQKKLIHQTPWYSHSSEVLEAGATKKPQGLIEFSIVLPSEMAHHVR